MYRVRYTAGFKEDDAGILQLPPEIATEVYPLVEYRWNAMCSDEDDKCNTCGTDEPAIALKLQTGRLLFRFLPFGYSHVASRIVLPEVEPETDSEVTADPDGVMPPTADMDTEAPPAQDAAVEL